MLTMFAVGAGAQAFVSLLVPAFMIEVTGDPSSTGLVMAAIALGSLAAPPLGRLADKHSAHRLVLIAGVFGMAISLALFALSTERATIYALDALLMGVSVAAVSATGPVLIISANLSQEVEARQMTSLQLMLPAGQLIGGLILAAVASWSFDARFWLGAGFLGIFGAIAVFTTAAPVARLHSALAASPQPDPGEAPRAGLRQILVSSFGLLLLVLVLSSMANNGINSQISNILPEVYGIDERATAALIALAGLLNVGLFILAGWWMGRSGPFPILLTGVVIRTAGALAMAIVGSLLDNAFILGAASMQLMYQSLPFVRLGQPTVAARFGHFSQGVIQGWVIAAVAAGAVIGSVVGGFLADGSGFNAINWMAAVAGGCALALMVLAVATVYRRLEQETEPVEGP
ncbi:MAG: MFS transporter [Acidimicrobiales bacterium]